jgi:hypothetical protein
LLGSHSTANAPHKIKESGVSQVIISICLDIGGRRAQAKAEPQDILPLWAHGEARYGERKAIETDDWEGPDY